jgi:cytochrome P450
MPNPAALLTARPEDVHQLYRELRETDDGVHVIEDANWRLFFRYADVSKILKSPAAYSSDRFWQSAAAIHDKDNPVHQHFVDIFKQMMLMQDPPVHTRLRGLVRHSFTPRSLTRMREAIERVTDEVLDNLREGEEVDFMPNFADLIPVQVIADVMGIPVDDRQQFRAWSTGFAIPLEFSCLGEARERALADAGVFLSYLDDLIVERRAYLGDDIVSLLIMAEEDGDRLSADELLAMISILLVAGNETTVNLLGNGLNLLLAYPDQLRALTADPTLIDGAVEEMLRYEPSFRWIARVMKEDGEINGQAVRAGTWIYSSVAAANRDPRRFADPEVFDIKRQDNHHLAFGAGIHFCVGAPLARMEAQIAIPKLLARFPRIARGSADPVYAPHFNIRHPASLQVIL